MSDDTSMLARGGRTDAGGKLTARFDIPVTEELNEAAIALAIVNGVPKAELLRMMLERMFFGELNMLRRMAGAGGNGNRTNFGDSAQ